MTWTIYLSGEIHTNWREQIMEGAVALGLPVEFTSAVTDHEASDAAGDMLGAEPGQHGFSQVGKARQIGLAVRGPSGKALRIQITRLDQHGGPHVTGMLAQIGRGQHSPPGMANQDGGRFV